MHRLTATLLLPFLGATPATLVLEYRTRRQLDKDARQLRALGYSCEVARA